MKLQPFKKAIVSFLIVGLIGLPSAITEAASNSNAIVNTASLNVRSKPDAQSTIVGALKQNSLVVASNESYGWVKIKSGSIEGWVAGQYLQKQDAVQSDKSTQMNAAKNAATSNASTTVLADSLNMRKGPGTQHGIVTVLSAGASLEVMKRQQDWVQVRTAKGDMGWVLSTYLGAAPKPKETVTASSSNKGLKGKLIVIDPGHGGSDAGTQGKKYGTHEKTLNLSTANYIADKLRQAGALVTMTRTGEAENPSLSSRVAVSEKQRADAFVSVHYNASPKPNSGTLTFYYSSSKDMPLARKIEAQLNRALDLKSNGISYGNYHVLRENARPSVLVELGFLSNAKDEQLVKSSAYQLKAAEAIVNGLQDYFKG